MNFKKFAVILIALAVCFSIVSVAVSADIPTKLPDGVTKVITAKTSGTRNEAWKKEDIIELPLGEEFDGGGTNHGIYSIEHSFTAGDIFYTYWVVKVLENDDAEGSTVMSFDPSWKSATGEIEVGMSERFLADDFEAELYYDDITPGKWIIWGAGFDVNEDVIGDATKVELRLHYKNVAAVQFKYLVITNKPMNFALNEETGEIDGITNTNAFVEPTEPPKTEAPTPAPATPTPDATSAPATTSNPGTTSASAASNGATTAASGENQNSSDGDSTLIIIGIVLAVIVIAGGVFIVLKKKKQ